RIQCVNNIRQSGLSFRVWEGDQQDRYPMAVSSTEGGAREFVYYSGIAGAPPGGYNAWKVFQCMSNELNTPKVCYCPAAPASGPGTKTQATYFQTFGAGTSSYFVNGDANEADPQMILYGDMNIGAGTAGNSSSAAATLYTTQQQYTFANMAAIT